MDKTGIIETCTHSEACHGPDDTCLCGVGIAFARRLDELKKTAAAYGVPLKIDLENRKIIIDFNGWEKDDGVV